MKIAFVSDAVYPWNIGGIETLEGAESRELAKKHEVHFFSFRWPGMEKEFERDGVIFHTKHNITKEKFYRHGRRSIREAMVFSIDVFRLFKYRFDYIQVNEFPVLHILPLKLYCMLYRCKLILDVHEVWDKAYWTSYLGGFFGGIANAYASAFIKVADAYIANSSVTAGRLEECGVDKNRIHVFTPVIDDRLMGGIKPVGNSQIVFYGRMIKEKRLDKWLTVIKKVSMKVRGLRVLLVGDGPERNGIRDMINQLGLSKTVEMRGFYSERDKKLLYGRVKGSQLLLQMSEREGLSLVVLESIALGTPVVLPDYSPVPNEVRRMCIIEPESRIPAKIVQMLKSGDKSRYINNAKDMDGFTISNIDKFYSSLFDSM